MLQVFLMSSGAGRLPAELPISLRRALSRSRQSRKRARSGTPGVGNKLHLVQDLVLPKAPKARDPDGPPRPPPPPATASPA